MRKQYPQPYHRECALKRRAGLYLLVVGPGTVIRCATHATLGPNTERGVILLPSAGRYAP